MKKQQIAKQKDIGFGKAVFLLGKDENAINIWLEAPKWDCGWYWGFGYVETYLRNLAPSKARDIDSHSHISSFIGNVNGTHIHNIYDTPKLVMTTFTEDEGWILTELFKSFYLLKEAAEFYGRGGGNTTTNPLAAQLMNKDECTRINQILIPLVTAEIIKMLKP